MSLLEFVGVNLLSNEELIIKDLSFKVESGDFISIVGPSGGGKSSILKLCCHLYKPTSGKILYKNKNMLIYNPIEIRKSIVYCFQTPHLFGKTVLDNFEFPYKIRNMKTDITRVQYLLQHFNMSKEYLKKDIGNLSGGEKQRISLIRSLLFQPDILLLDEATSALDSENTVIVENIINSLNKEGVTILWITHNAEQSRKYSNKILSIEGGSLKALEVLR